MELSASRTRSLSFFEYDVAELMKIVSDVSAGKKMLDGAVLISIANGKTKRVGSERFSLGKTVVVHSTKNSEEFALRQQDAMCFCDTAPHIFGGAVIEDAVAQNELKAVIGKGKRLKRGQSDLRV